MPDKLQETIDELGRAFAAFQAKNDQRLAEIEKNGTASSETLAAVKKSSDAILALQASVTEMQTQIRSMETAAARLVAVGEGPTKERAEVRTFLAQVRNVGEDEVQISDEDIEGYRAYRKAFLAYIRKGSKALADSKIQAALSVGTDTSGGYYVLPDMTGAIQKLVFETSPMRQVASVQNTSSDALEGYNDLDEAGSGWTGETGARTETTTPDIGMWRIPVFEQYANPRQTQKMLDDAQFDVEGWLTGKIADRLARQENLAFVFSGDGVAKPRAFISYANLSAPSKANWARVEATKTGVNGGFAASNPADIFLTVIGKTKMAYWPNARWAMNRTTLAAVMQLKDGQGRYFLVPDFREGFNLKLLGFPIVSFEDLAAYTVTGAYAIAFGDFQQGYQIADRQAIRLLRDPYTAKPYVQFYTTKRVGGDVVNFEALKLIQFST